MRRESPRVVIISQARVESTRLPGKVLLDLEGEPLLKRVWGRLMRSERADQVVLALPETTANDNLEAICRSWGAQTYRGSLEDVLARYSGAAACFSADVVVRVTSDCPFCDPDVIDAVVDLLLSDRSLDYASNNLKRSWPLGLDVEAFWVDALAAADRDSIENHEREHVTPFIYQNPERFRLANLLAPAWAARDYRLTVDEAPDLALARAVYASLDPMRFRVRDLTEFLDGHPEITALNEHVLNRDIARPESW